MTQMKFNINTIKVFPFLIAFLFLIPSSLLSQNYDDQVIEKLLDQKICDVEKIKNMSLSVEKKINKIKKNVASIESREMLQDIVRNQSLDCYMRINITNLLAANLYLNQKNRPALSLYTKLKSYRNLPQDLKGVINPRIEDIKSRLAKENQDPITEVFKAPLKKKDSYETEIVLLKEKINNLDDEIQKLVKDYSMLSRQISKTDEQEELDEIARKIESIKTDLQGKENLYLTLLGLVGALFVYMIFLHTRFNFAKENTSENEEEFSFEENDTSENALSVVLHEQILNSKVPISEVLDDFVIAYTDSLINNYEISQEDLPSIRSRLFKKLFNQSYENLIDNSDKTSEEWKKGSLTGLSDCQNILNGKLANSLKEYLIHKS